MPAAGKDDLVLVKRCAMHLDWPWVGMLVVTLLYASATSDSY